MEGLLIILAFVGFIIIYAHFKKTYKTEDFYDREDYKGQTFCCNGMYYDKNAYIAQRHAALFRLSKMQLERRYTAYAAQAHKYPDELVYQMEVDAIIQLLDRRP